MEATETQGTIEFDNIINSWIDKYFTSLGLSDTSGLLLKVIVLAVIVLLISYLVNKLTKYYIIKAIERIIRKTKSKNDDFFVDRQVFQRLSHLAPAFVLYVFNGIVFNDFPQIGELVHKGIMIYLVVVFVWSLTAFFSAIMDIYESHDYAQERPIKGYIQVAQIIGYFIGVLVVVSIVFNVKLGALFTGLGAIAAVLLLIFKDTILGLVASVQLSAYKMVRVGDWVSMPSHNADGTVLDISLNTVKIQNWDKTITTIPTYEMVSHPFMNWKGMEDSGGRRIKRAVNIDMSSVKFCSKEMLDRFKKIHFLKEYIELKQEEIENYNKENKIDESVLVNGRRLTNIGLFRKYLESYLHNHPKIHNEMTFLVRHLQPTEKGLPIEFYVFSNDQAWANYESIQADIMDHILAVLPEFELKVYQFPSSGTLPMS
ncbi:mechanosensitive ion channel family protein [Carboxylicivirga caseinilyticus]|uniref:mechanosensitive ion channel family protein n=1 Tax=Carboxylicivirga caseinilyticus TaxID=3417572 RepID=UPI003D338D7D